VLFFFATLRITLSNQQGTHHCSQNFHCSRRLGLSNSWLDEVHCINCASDEKAEAAAAAIGAVMRTRGLIGLHINLKSKEEEKTPSDQVLMQNKLKFMLQ
jgi:hypothetical protein